MCKRVVEGRRNEREGGLGRDSLDADKDVRILRGGDDSKGIKEINSRSNRR